MGRSSGHRLTIEPFASFINGVEKFVVTATTPERAWANATVVGGNLPEFIRELKRRSGGDIGVHGSIALAQSLLEAGLVDELRLVVAPAVQMHGRKLFDRGMPRRMTLSRERRLSVRLPPARLSGSRAEASLDERRLAGRGLLLDPCDMALAQKRDHDDERREHDNGSDAERPVEADHERVQRHAAGRLALLVRHRGGQRGESRERGPICCEVLKSPDASP